MEGLQLRGCHRDLGARRQDDVFTSVHIEEFEHQVRDTKRGEEELTREIPNVSEEATKDLDERGIVRIGAESGRATSSSARSRPRARPTRRRKRSCSAPSSATKRAT